MKLQIVSVLFVMTLLSASDAAEAAVRYAAPVARGSGDCSSWQNAGILRTALALAQSGDEIWVEKGVHYPIVAEQRAVTFTLKNGVAVYGGFNGTETDRDQRNWQTNKTILSGDVDQNDINTDGNYIAETWNDIRGANSYHVITGSGTDNTAVLDGFVITAGQANDESVWEVFGGGMYNYNGSPTVRNVIFCGNFASDSGGGMYNEGSSPTLTNVTFSGNFGRYGGGGMYNYDKSNPTLTTVAFLENQSEGYGGGMYNFIDCSPTLTGADFSRNLSDIGGGIAFEGGGSATLTDIRLTENTANKWGGGIYSYNSKQTLNNITVRDNTAVLWGGGGIFNLGSDNTTTIRNSTFIGNKTQKVGGGIYTDSNSSPTIINVIFEENSADEKGGGFYLRHYCNPVLTNVVFRKNTAGKSGGAICCTENSSPVLINTTLNDNSAVETGGGITNYYYGNPILKNVIIWGNSAPSNPEIYNYQYSTPDISYSDIQGCGGSGAGWNSAFGTDGGGNIDLNPRFVDAAGGDLRLYGVSPCVDVGNNSANNEAYDIRGPGYPRKLAKSGGDGTIDMGAYEFNTNYDPDKPIAVKLAAFTAARVQEGVELRWRTECESGLAGFIVERRQSGEAAWSEIASFVSDVRLAAEGGVAGREYVYMDRYASAASTGSAAVTGAALSAHSYRLTAVSVDGSLSRFGEMEVGALPLRFGIVSTYPNPFNPEVTVRCVLSASGQAALRVYNVLGEQVAELFSGLAEAGEHTVVWRPEDLSGGVYWLELRSGAERSIMKISYAK